MDLDPELQRIMDENDLTRQVRQHYAETDSYQAVLKTKYNVWHQFYAPPDGDQWPEDKHLRPGMIHVTANVVQPAADIESRLEGLLPRVSNIPDNTEDDAERLRSEAAEKLMLRFLELSGWDVWLTDLTKCKFLYGKSVLKVFWNKDDQRPDARVVENPANLRIGWGASDFSVMDWALYEYAISPAEAMRRYPVLITQKKGGIFGAGKTTLMVQRVGKHDDPLSQLPPIEAFNGSVHDRPRPNNYVPSTYEDKQIAVWDYWFKDEKNVVKNAVFVGGVLAQDVTTHKYLPDIPYIIIEHDHEPGSPEGLSGVDPLKDVQIEINRALSHWCQLVADEIDPAYQLDADAVPAGMIPKGGQVLAAGEGKQVRPIPKGVNDLPIQQLLAELYRTFHFVTGLSEILFSMPPGAQTAGRALQIQIESAANRLDPRRRRLYRGLYELLVFWSYMIEKVNPKVTVDGEKVGLAEITRGLRRWKFVAPEITPRDVAEATQNVMNQVNARLKSLETGMDDLGIDSPLEEMKRIMQERTNPALFPGDTQAYAAVFQLLQQLQITQQQIQQQINGSFGGGGGAPAPGGPAGGAPAPEDTLGQMQAQAQMAQPQLGQEDNGAGGPPQPMTVPGGPPPVGGPAIGNQSLIRNTPTGGALALQQIALKPGGGA